MQMNKPFATVTPTLDGDVLAVLAGAHVPFTISQVQRILDASGVGASGEGVRKVLNRLAEQGVVLHDRVGRTHTYSFNTEHLAAEAILALSRLNSTFLSRLEQHLADWGPALSYGAVFGSAATGRMMLGSDIDIFLVRGPDADDERWAERLTELGRLIAAWTGNDGRIVEYTEDDFRAAALAGEPLFEEVSKQGRTVAGTRSWFTAQLRSARSS